MDESLGIFPLLVIGLFSGLAGGLAMNLLMRVLSRQKAVPVDMRTVLGSLMSGRSGKQAQTLGTAIHLTSGFLFGLLYIWGMYSINRVSLPASIPIGIGFGFAHGVVVSFLLMFLNTESQPHDEKRRDAVTFSLGPIHIAGHVAYGATVGLVGGLLMLAFG